MRIHNSYSLHEEEKPELCEFGHAIWRTIECDGERDIVECSRCGRQKEVSCNFDEEFN